MGLMREEQRKLLQQLGRFVKYGDINALKDVVNKILDQENQFKNVRLRRGNVFKSRKCIRVIKNYIFLD